MTKKMELVYDEAKQKVGDIYEKQLKKKKTGVNNTKEPANFDLSDLLSN